jgi:hypothetical protein
MRDMILNVLFHISIGSRNHWLCTRTKSLVLFQNRRKCINFWISKFLNTIWK